MSVTKGIRGSLDSDWTYTSRIACFVGGVGMLLSFYGSQASINDIHGGLYHLPPKFEFP